MTRNDSTPTHVMDRRGVRYRLDSLIGEGAQGKVFSVADSPRLAVKLSSSRNAEEMRYQFAFVRHLPLEKLRVARPLELLQAPHLGYVMERLVGKAALRKTLYWRQGGGRASVQYLQSGGLYRRLRLLADLAGLLEALHNDGLAYGDLSPDNVFAPATPDGFETHLIDADNLRRSSSPGREIYTPRYGAPEVVRNETGISTLSDAHAFAVIAFEVLCFVHPLIGEYVEDGEPELEEAALRGDLPWIHDASNPLNRVRENQGIPAEYVLTRELFRLFDLTFTKGLAHPRHRPGMGEWRRALEQAALQTYRCPECERVSLTEGKPWCGHTRPSLLKVIAQVWSPELAELGLTPVDSDCIWVIRDGETLILTESDARVGTRDEALLNVRLTSQKGKAIVRLDKAGEHPVYMDPVHRNHPDKKWQELSRKVPLAFLAQDPDEHYLVYVRPKEQPQRTFRFVFLPEAPHEN